MDFGWPGFRIGVIYAVLNISGIFPVSRDMLNIIQSGSDIESLHFFIRMAGMPSGPGAAFGASSSIAFLTSISSRAIFSILNSFGESLKKSFGVFILISSFGSLNAFS